MHEAGSEVAKGVLNRFGVSLEGGFGKFAPVRRTRLRFQLARSANGVGRGRTGQAGFTVWLGTEAVVQGTNTYPYFLDQARRGGGERHRCL